MGIASALQLVMDLFGGPTPTVGAVAKPRSSAPPEPPARTDPVALEFSRRRRRGWRLTRERGVWVCQVPEAFRAAPEDICEELQDWIRLSIRPRPGSRARRRQIERRIFEWMGPRIQDRIPAKEDSRGEALDLRDLFEELNRAHFGGSLRAVVRWSPRIGGLSTHQELRTSDGIRHLLTISRAYDGRDVPRVAVEGVLFHEMCHIAHPPRAGRGARRIVHHREFREAERRFPGWDEWRRWEAANLRRRVRRLERLLPPR